MGEEKKEWLYIMNCCVCIVIAEIFLSKNVFHNKNVMNVKWFMFLGFCFIIPPLLSININNNLPQIQVIFFKKKYISATL